METRVTLRLHNALLDRLDHEAAAAGVTRSELIRRRLDRLPPPVAAETAEGLAELVRLGESADEPLAAAWLSGAEAALRAVAGWDETPT